MLRLQKQSNRHEPSDKNRSLSEVKRTRTLVASINGKGIALKIRYVVMPVWLRIMSRSFIVLSVLVLVFTVIIPDISQHLGGHDYSLTKGETALLPTTDKILAKDISYSIKSESYSFQNAQTSPDGPATASAGTSMISAEFPTDATKGITVRDPINEVTFSAAPDFAVSTARQDTSHIYYPFSNGAGQLVYSPQASDVLEDLILNGKLGNVLHFDYSLDLGNNLAARIQKDGSVGIFGSTLSTLGNISTDNPNDASRVVKAEGKAPKNKLLFDIPIPTIKETDRSSSVVKASYSLLKHNVLRITATNLDKASYPLDIDPTVSVQSVSQLYRDTNAESNADFNTSNGSINRGAVTGGVFSTWNTNANSLTTSRYLDSSVISNGYVYVGGGANSNSNTNLGSLEYAQINSTNNTIGAWANLATGMPGGTGVSQERLLSYNGYLYTLGGSNDTVGTAGGCATPTSSVYYNPTQPNGAIASTWTSTTALPVAMCSFGAAIYNNTIYVIGGQTAAGSAHGTTSVYYASILPNGAIGTWTTSSVTLPTALYDDDVQIYNGYIYVVGGTSNAASPVTVSTIYRAALNSNGSIYGTSGSNWASLPNTFASADKVIGTSYGISNAGSGSFTAVNDGYMYVAGGCTIISTTNQNCTTINGNSYISPINADGTLGPWSKIGSTNNEPYVGGSLLVFGGYLYQVAGCSAMSTTFQCTSGDTIGTQFNAPILSSGQIGPVTDLYVQNGNTGTNYELPVGLFDEAAVVNNGYIYVIGGCTNKTCSVTSEYVYQDTITDSGSIGPSWTTSAYHIYNNATAANGGLGAISAVVYDNYIYISGGWNGNGAVGTNCIWYAQTLSTGDLAGNFTGASATGTTTTCPTAGNTMANSEYSSSDQLVSSTGGNAYLFVFGGCSATTFGCSTYYKTNFRYTLGPTGPVYTSGTSAVTTIPALPDAQDTANNCVATAGASTVGSCYTGEAAMGSVYYNGYIYLIGGAGDCNGGACSAGSLGQSSVIQYAKMNTSTGVLGAWAYATDFLPNALRRTSAFALNGYIYVIGGHNALANSGNGQTYGTIDIAPVDLSNGNINAGTPTTGITTSSSMLVFNEWDGAVTSVDGTVYEIGGCNVGAPPASCTGFETHEQVFQIYNADNTGTAPWSTPSTTYAASNTVGGSSVAYNGYLYSAGGCTTFTESSLSCSAVASTVSYASLNPDGSVGTWSSGSAIGSDTSTDFGCLLQNNGYLYYIGGENSAGTPASSVYFSQIGTNGVPGTWQATTALPNARSRIGCDSFDGVLYVTGGLQSSGTYETTTYYAVPNTTTGAINSWGTFTPQFTAARDGLSAVVAGGYLYVIGGYNGTTFYSDVQEISITPATGAPIAASWTVTRNLPMATAFAQPVIANGYIYLFGGTSGTATTSCTNATYIAPILNTGETGAWTQSIDNFTTARLGVSAAYYNGYYYVINGYNCAGSANITGTTAVMYGGEQSEAMQSFFTRYADLGGDASPELFVPFVTNAQINNVDVEDWKMAYITSTQEANAWGVTTTINPLTSGTASNVYAYNGSGTNVELNRYAQLAFSISMTKSFTFPDNTQPSVNAYYLYYSPAPQNRLRNGKDFQDEQQQGLDLNL
jgi:N-acetylneuraminic acid mutarotase